MGIEVVVSKIIACYNYDNSNGPHLWLSEMSIEHSFPRLASSILAQCEFDVSFLTQITLNFI